MFCPLFLCTERDKSFVGEEWFSCCSSFVYDTLTWAKGEVWGGKEKGRAGAAGDNAVGWGVVVGHGVSREVITSGTPPLPLHKEEAHLSDNHSPEASRAVRRRKGKVAR